MATELLFSELKAWLDAQPENTASTPYEIIIKDAPESGYTDAITRFVSIVGMKMAEGVTSIGYQAFRQCTKLVSIVIPSGLTSLGQQVFSGCKNLVSTVINYGITDISATCFNACEKLEHVSIPTSVTSIKPSAFAYCYGLTSITIPGSVTFIGVKAFIKCNNLKSVYMYPAFSETLLQANSYGTSFGETSSKLKLYVPSGNLSGWKSATLTNYGFASGVAAEAMPLTKKWIRIA